MGGKHIPLVFESNNYEYNLKELHNLLTGVIEDYMEEYNYCGINLIMIMSIPLRKYPELELNNINHLKLDKDLIKIGETKRNFNNLKLPLSMEEEYYGNKLEKHIQRVGNSKHENITQVILDNKNIIPLIGEKSKLINKLINGVLDTDFYEYINKKNRKYIIVLKKIDKDTNLIEVFDLRGNDILFAKDIRKNNDTFEREIGKISLTIKNDKNVINYYIKDSLPAIQHLKPTTETVRNTKIGTFDVETYFKSEENKSYVYALGYKVYDDETKLFYKSESQSSGDLVRECIDSMLKPKYDGFIFFVHNFSGYDVVFLLSVLVEYNKREENYYTLDPIFRDERIIRLDVSIKHGLGKVKISFVDSYNLLNKSLDALTKDFECEQTKGKFPYTFVNESTLNYIGNTPDIEYFNNISDEEYNTIKIPN